jgi:hypothetical protein
MRDDSRQKVVGKYAFGPFVIAVNRERDALMQKRQIGGLLALAEEVRARSGTALCSVAAEFRGLRTSRRRLSRTDNYETEAETKSKAHPGDSSGAKVHEFGYGLSAL